jgi:hypothetical protein
MGLEMMLDAAQMAGHRAFVGVPARMARGLEAFVAAVVERLVVPVEVAPRTGSHQEVIGKRFVEAAWGKRSAEVVEEVAPLVVKKPDSGRSLLGLELEVLEVMRSQWVVWTALDLIFQGPP